MWDLMKRVFHFISTILLYSLFLILIIVGIMVGLYFVDYYKSVKDGTNRAPLFGAYVIISPSMVPNINVLDAVVTMRVDADKLKKNDVITFISQDPRHSGITVTHRIVGVKKTESGDYAYRTKGDNNNVEDQTLVSYDKVIGKVMLRIPYIGYLQQLLTTKFGWIIAIVFPCLIIISGDIVKLLKLVLFKKDSSKTKKKMDAREEVAKEEVELEQALLQKNHEEELKKMQKKQKTYKMNQDLRWKEWMQQQSNLKNKKEKQEYVGDFQLHKKPKQISEEDLINELEEDINENDF